MKFCDPSMIPSVRFERPPLGLRPRYCVDANENPQARRGEILAAMTRYNEAGKIIPYQWVRELELLIIESHST